MKEEKDNEKVHIVNPFFQIKVVMIDNNFFRFTLSINGEISKTLQTSSLHRTLPSGRNVSMNNHPTSSVSYKIMKIEGVIGVLGGKIDGVVISSVKMNINNSEFIVSIFNWNDIKKMLSSEIKFFKNKMDNVIYNTLTPNEGNIDSILFVITIIVVSIMDTNIKEKIRNYIVNELNNNHNIRYVLSSINLTSINEERVENNISEENVITINQQTNEDMINKGKSMKKFRRIGNPDDPKEQHKETTYSGKTDELVTK